ncbi:hypothetical protein ACW5W6_06930 [Aeromonas mytilicola]
MATEWEPFDYSDFECGLFWLLVESPDVDIDADDDGTTVGCYTGEVIRSAVLAMVEEGDEGEPEFEPVDRANVGRLDWEVTVTHFAKVVAPSIPAN